VESLFILKILFPIFAHIGLGYLFRSLSIVKDTDIDVLNGYAYYVAFPALMFVSLYTTDFSEISNPVFYSVNIICAFIAMVCAFIVCKMLKFERSKIGVIMMASYFGNNAYMGLPVVQLAFGDSALPYGAIISGINITIALTFGLGIIEHFSENEKGRSTNFGETIIKLFKVPLLWGVILGIAFSFFSTLFREELAEDNVANALEYFSFIHVALSMLKSTASPIALFSLGAFLFGRMPKKEFRELAVISTLKLILLPLVIVLLSFLFNLRNIEYNVSLTQAAMPLAVTNFVISKQYRIQEEFVANSVVITTLISILTIPLSLSLFVNL